MSEEQPVSLNPTQHALFVKIEHNLARIAHAVEAIAEKHDPDFKDLDQTLAEQKRALRSR